MAEARFTRGAKAGDAFPRVRRPASAVGDSGGASGKDCLLALVVIAVVLLGAVLDGGLF